MNVLFNIKFLNNINVENNRFLYIDPDHNHDFQLPNCINVDPNYLLWCFDDFFVWGVSLLAGDRPMSPQFQKVHHPPLLPITDQFS